MRNFLLSLFLTMVGTWTMAQELVPVGVYNNEPEDSPAGLAETQMSQTLEDSINWGILTPEQFDRIKMMAESGHSTSQYYLGRCFFKGLCVAKDHYQAVANYGLAAEKDQTEALYYLGFCYQFGYGVPSDKYKADLYFKRALSWLEQESETQAYSMYYLAMCHTCGFGVDRDVEKGVKLYERAAEMGCTQALFNMAIDKQFGNNMPVDMVGAASLFEQAALLGNPQAQYSLSLCYRNGEGVQKDIDKADEWLRRAEEQGWRK